MIQRSLGLYCAS